MTLGGRSAKILLAALAVSLVVNFVGAGYLIAARFWHEPPPMGFTRAVLLAGRIYPPEIQDALKEALGKRPEALRRAFRAMREARRETFEAMRADPLDPARLAAALADERARTEELQEAGHAILAAAVAAAPADVRAEIRPMRGREGKAGRGPDGKGPPDGPPPPDDE